MTTTKKDPVLVVLQLSGGNDYLNTIIPYNDSILPGCSAQRGNSRG